MASSSIKLSSRLFVLAAASRARRIAFRCHFSLESNVDLPTAPKTYGLYRIAIVALPIVRNVSLSKI